MKMASTTTDNACDKEIETLEAVTLLLALEPETLNDVSKKSETRSDTSAAMPISTTHRGSNIEKVEEPGVGVPNEGYYLKILEQYLISVRAKETHSAFLQDSVVGPFLSLCLASNSDKVLIAVLKVIGILVQQKDNIPRLRELLHFTDALLDASRNENVHSTVQKKAASLYDLIQNKRDSDNKPQDCMDNNTGTKENSKPLSYARKTQLYINHALNKERRFVITRTLVRIDGVISIAFNLDERLCIIRSRRVRPETLAVTVSNLGFECSLISKNENNEIVRIPIVPESQEKKENCEPPFYFPEDDEEEPVGDNAVAVKGFAEGEDDNSWWNSTKKLVRKSLFW